MRYEHLYVHVPFCARRCVYCDFSIAVRPVVPASEYVSGVAAELRMRHAESALELQTLYFGGGTPSKLGGDGVSRLMDGLRERARLASGAEVTLEANPEDVSAETVRAWRNAGVNRLSLGVQSFDDATLKWMHRTHDATQAAKAVRVARDAGIDNLSIDLIFAVPANLKRSWRQDIDAALELEVPHLSIYGLTVEPQTPFGRWVARHDVDEAPEEQFEQEFLLAHETLTNAGYAHYEVSNYGRPRFESRHNNAYWNRSAYAGLGPSAHEFDGDARRWNTDPYADWLKLLNEGRAPTKGDERLDARQVDSEIAYLGLRTSAGLPASMITESERNVLRSAGFAQVSDRVQLTPEGWLRLDSIAANLTLHRSRY